MKTTNVNFTEINKPLNNEFIESLGKIYAPNDDDNPMFIIKTSHSDEKMIPDENEICGFRMEKYIEEKTFVMNVFKISNGWLGTINGHFTCDYNGYTITHISELKF